MSTGIDYTGDLILVGHNLYSIEPASLRDRIIILESILMSEKKIGYVVEHGGRGILFAAERDLSQNTLYGDRIEKCLSTAGKSGARLMVGNIIKADYLQATDRAILWTLLGVLLISLLITALHSASPDLKIRGVSTERIYHHPAAELIRNVIHYALPIGSALFLLVLLVNLPPNGNIEPSTESESRTTRVFLQSRNPFSF